MCSRDPLQYQKSNSSQTQQRSLWPFLGSCVWVESPMWPSAATSPCRRIWQWWGWMDLRACWNLAQDQSPPQYQKKLCLILERLVPCSSLPSSGRWDWYRFRTVVCRCACALLCGTLCCCVCWICWQACQRCCGICLWDHQSRRCSWLDIPDTASGHLVVLPHGYDHARDQTMHLYTNLFSLWLMVHLPFYMPVTWAIRWYLS